MSEITVLSRESVVTRVPQSSDAPPARVQPTSRIIYEASVSVRVTNNGRLLGLDLGDWSLLVVGFAT
jgi:hypothetical protein